jgi:hypothetical protein
VAGQLAGCGSDADSSQENELTAPAAATGTGNSQEVGNPDSSTSEQAGGSGSSCYAEAAGSVEYEEIDGLPPDVREVTLCELLSVNRGGSGVYEVQRLVGVNGFTYIDLHLISAWSSMSPETPSVKVIGGPVGDSTRVWQLDHLAKGETIGALLREPEGSAAGGCYGLNALGLFARTGDGYTNGMLFDGEPLSLDEISVLVQSALADVENGGCADSSH